MMTHLTPKALVVLFFLFLHCFSLVLSLASDSEILIRVKKTQLDDPYGSLNDWVSNREHNPYSDPPKPISRQQYPQQYNHFPSLSRCSHLHFLSPANNYFSGKLPDFSPEFTNLENLDLSDNFFTGKIPASFGRRFPVLRFLHLRSNNITDSIPSFLGNLRELTLLELISNPLMPGPLPPEIGNLTKLEIMYFSGLNLIGTIPDSIGKLVSLKNLDLFNNSLSGEIPESIGGLKSIEQIELYQNNLSGGLPETIANLRTLLRLDVSENNLSGTLSEKIAAMPLNSLNLNDNFFEGQVPEVLASNPVRHELKIFNNSFSGQLPKNLGKNSDLVNIDVSTNKFTGELPMYLCYRKKLERLVTFKNSFSRTIPMSYGECDSLNYVRIEQNELSGEVPEGFWSHPGLTRLQMFNNRLQGSISHNISLASELVAISIARNNFTGEIPVEICQLQQLVVFSLSQNQFSGVLPTCITGLKKLQKVLVQENMLSGEIPRNVSSLNWKALSCFNLSGNRFSGTIPPDLGTLPVLTYLDLSEKLLTGEIPESLTKLKLTEFNLSNNNLDGRVPLEFDTKFYLPSLLDNPNLCSNTLKPLALCSRPRTASSYSELLVLSGFCVIILVLSLVWLYKTKYPPLGDPKPKLHSQMKVIAFQQIGFTEQDIFPYLRAGNQIGSGGSGRVYKVKLKTGQTVAVKKLWGKTQNPDLDLERVFRSEVETLGLIRHTNVLKLLFCCSNEECRLLVYEYMENGSLGDVLHGDHDSVDLLDWPKRFMIALGTAQGLAYLHHDCVPPIVHRDVKSNNILLDQDWRPRLADFGLAKSLHEVGEGPGAMSGVAGSYGYIASEYGFTLRVAEKSDVYSFGVMLLELITDKRPNDPSFGDNNDLVKWVSGIVISSAEEGSSDGIRNIDLVQLIDPKLDPFSCDCG
ncbi:hypothetical protein SO802_025866 [Lithocarpus litseifolius]|uniref:Protein kinase domain-containing protein n=1 Tax=Lithocarpus litseifolius TaxID=425828 RepID=A0AAW2BZS3_9ROSI